MRRVRCGQILAGLGGTLLATVMCGGLAMAATDPASISGSSLSGLVGGSAPSNSSNVTINGTFNNTSNSVKIKNSNEMTFTDNSQVTVSNSNCQNVSTGSVSLNDVASGGNLTSGSASASNTTSTTITR
jgi:hypothetical protein